MGLHAQLRAIGGLASAESALIFSVLPFAKPHAYAAAVFVYEFHPSALKRADYSGKGRRIAGIAASFNIGHSIAVDASRRSEVPDAPIEGGTRHSYLCACHRHLDCAIVTCADATIES